VQVIPAGGAGHKMVMVVEGRADLYINSAPSVYMWDTCGPHSLLASLGGGVVTFNQQQVNCTIATEKCVRLEKRLNIKWWNICVLNKRKLIAV
jgi:3'-phosphoadenosine 5'-phosphosulfate (PAPS) 3'-phosphatase